MGVQSIGIKHKPLDEVQKRAIVRSVSLGKRIQREHPHIAYLRRQGRTLSNIASALNLQEEYGVKPSIAEGGVHYALAGHTGLMGLPQYEGLLPESEREDIAKECRAAHTSTLGGRNGYEAGLAKLASTRRIEISRQANLAQGQMPWIERGDKLTADSQYAFSESDYAYFLSQQGLTRREIAAELNENFHQGTEIRTPNAVKVKLLRR